MNKEQWRQLDSIINSAHLSYSINEENLHIASDLLKDHGEEEMADGLQYLIAKRLLPSMMRPGVFWFCSVPDGFHVRRNDSFETFAKAIIFFCCQWKVSHTYRQYHQAMEDHDS